MSRMLIAALAATTMLAATSMIAITPAAATTPEAWAKWADRAEGLSSYLESLTPGKDSKIEIGEGARRACRGAETQLLFGGYPKWAGSLLTICNAYGAMGGGKASVGKGCKYLLLSAKDLGKGVPVPEEPRVEPARLRLLTHIEGSCGKH